MMRLQTAKSWDFNQMLVASVFGHLLLMTFVLFLPKSSVMKKIIPPAFMVELVEISRGEIKPVKKPVQKKKPKKKLTPVPVKKTKPLPPAKTVKAAPPVKPTTPPKIVEPIRSSVKVLPEPKLHKINRNASDRILNSLDKLKNTPAKLNKELGQLASLAPKVSLKNPVIKKSKPIQENTFDESSMLKNAELMPNVESPSNEPAVETKSDSSLKDLEFASLSQHTVKLEKKQDDKSSADLLKELAEMEQQPIANGQPMATQSQEISAPSITEEKSQAFDSILKKLDSLAAPSQEIDTNIVVPETIAQNFQSDIRKVSVPEQVQVDVVVSPNQAYVQSPLTGKPGADALSLYKGMIIKKVMENWHAPLGQDHNKKVIVSFNIYPRGNIDRPDLKKSSKVELLDDLALRAIRDSEPFPKFPESLKSSNLNINIHFKYIPEKNKT